MNKTWKIEEQIKLKEARRNTALKELERIEDEIRELQEELDREKSEN